MRNAGNFHPEWGYLAPAPSFLRTARIVIVATAVGATAGAGVVFSLVDRPAGKVDQSSVAARTLVRPVVAVSTPAGPPAPAPSDLSAKSTMQLPAGISALAEVPAATDASPVQIRDRAGAAAPAAPAAPAPVAVPVQKKATRKHRSTSHYASREASRGEQPNSAAREPSLLRRLFNYNGDAPAGEYFGNEAGRGY